MANLRDIQKRINSVQSTKQITRTMEMVSSAKIGKATKRMEAGRPYAIAISKMLKRLSDGDDTSSVSPLLQKHDEVKNAIIIAVVSDRGLAGGFNTSVLRNCDHMKARLESEGTDVGFIACGKKAVGYFNYRKYNIVKPYTDLSADPTLNEARDIANICAKRYLDGTVDEVYIVYNHARNSADQDLIEDKILPIETSEEDAESKDESQTQYEKTYEFDPSSAVVLADLLPSYFVNAVYSALVDSAAAEQGARRKAMKAATDNATDMIETLSRVYNRLRQGAITTELTEIVSGAAASEE